MTTRYLPYAPMCPSNSGQTEVHPSLSNSGGTLINQKRSAAVGTLCSRPALSKGLGGQNTRLLLRTVLCCRRNRLPFLNHVLSWKVGNNLLFSDFKRLEYKIKLSMYMKMLWMKSHWICTTFYCLKHGLTYTIKAIWMLVGLLANELQGLKCLKY